MGSSVENIITCPVCTFTCTSRDELDAHESSQRHHYNTIVEQFQNKRKSKIKDRHGVAVEASCSTHSVTYMSSNGSAKITANSDVTEVTYTFTVKNTNTPVELLSAILLHPLHYFSLKLDGNNPQIGDGEFRKVNVTFKSPGVGLYCVPVCFYLKKSGRDFQIIRDMIVEVKSQNIDEVEEEDKESPFTGEPWFGMRKVVPAFKENGETFKKITEYPIPKQYEPLFKHNLYVWHDKPPMTPEQLELLYQLLGSFPKNCGYNTGFKNAYAMFFHTMLYLDEYTTVRHLHRYHMSEVSLCIVAPNRVELEVPGLAEKRPSVIRGDVVSARVRVGPDSWETVEYEGIIAEVRDSVVWIKGFHPRLIENLEKFGNELKFDVRFLFNRYPMYLMHRAIDLAQEEILNTILFPAGVELLPSLVPNDNYPFFNKQVFNNAEQRTAVRNIVKGEARPAPYIVFGPPGTGKTNTIVEAILQIKILFRKSFIVVCAASNSACDYITQKLIGNCTPEELLRLHSPSRDLETIPKDILRYSNCLGGKKFKPSDWKLYRIVVCTLVNAGSKLAERNDDLFRTIHHYTHVFIDEAGQALEPETLVALAGVLGPPSRHNVGGQLVLAGDPKQLGPICTSTISEDNGLGVSLLERLMLHCPLYQRSDEGNFNPLYITKLLENFRSHPSLLQLPNKLFYDNELKASCGLEITNDQVGSIRLLGKKDSLVHRCVFYGVIGQERREGKSPSFYNQQELDVVMQYITALLSLTSSVPVNVKQSDIGIISPYIRQVYKLKNCLQSRGWTDVEVGTTETFQGREKRIILISTVRSNRNLLDYDKKYRLGFLNNRKRFNVAITRARSLLIVIGCPHILELDEVWMQLIEYSNSLGSYDGCNYTLQEDSWVQEVLARITKPLLADEC